MKVQIKPYVQQVAILFLCGVGWLSLPDVDMGPYQAVNPHDTSEFIFTALSISFFASLLNSVLDSRFGLMIAGFLGGFFSSTATIHNFGVMNKNDSGLLNFASIGAVLSNVATLVQVLILTHLLEKELFEVLMLPAFLGILMLFLSAAVIYALGRRDIRSESMVTNYPFNWASTFYLALLLLFVTVISTGLNKTFGSSALLVGAVFSGIADAHAIIAGVANMLKTQNIEILDAKLAVLLAFSSNSLFKVFLAYHSGGYEFAKKIAFAIVLCNIGIWSGVVFFFKF